MDKQKLMSGSNRQPEAAQGALETTQLEVHGRLPCNKGLLTADSGTEGGDAAVYLVERTVLSWRQVVALHLLLHCDILFAAVKVHTSSYA